MGVTREVFHDIAYIPARVSPSKRLQYRNIQVQAKLAQQNSQRTPSQEEVPAIINNTIKCFKFVTKETQYVDVDSSKLGTHLASTHEWYGPHT